MQTLKDRIYKYGIVPVVTFASADQAIPTAQALNDGGLEIAEITFRTPCAPEALKAITAKFPEMTVGAGTITTVEQARKAVECGAKFIVSPGCCEEIIRFGQEKNILVIPGCMTATEVQKAVGLGLDTVKFFPAETSGGAAAVNALAAAFPGVRFMPTGGIGPDKFSNYSRNTNVIACGTSWVTPGEALASGDYETVRLRARDAVFAMLNFAFAHVGINCDTVPEGYTNIFNLADMFDLILGDTESSSYVGREVEITKQPFKVRGIHGHLGYFTDNIERAVFYLGKQGIEFNEASIKPHQKKMYVIYLKELIGGFAVHIEERNNHNPPAWEHRDIVKNRINWKG